jgi:L-ascorbate metabolism protein UlaG (beta-lactamase superfamily)
MRITKYIHACLLVEEGGERILFDPGKFSFVEGLVKPEVFQDISAVIITHQHPDHVDDDALAKIIGNNPAAVLLTNTDLQTRLAEKKISAEVLESGRRNVGNFSFEAVEAKHANLLNSEPPRNIAYVVNDRLLNPGDSFDHTMDRFRGIELLALPAMAPWNTELDVAEFAQRISPRRIIPIHDGYAKDFFLQLRYENYQKYFSGLGIEFSGLAKPGDFVEI